MVLILTMLVLSLMQAVFLYSKVSNQVVNKHEVLYQLESVAHQLIMAEHNPHCESTGEDMNQIIDLLLHNSGCSLTDRHQHYYYWIDDLGIYPCLHIVSGKKINSSHHWLVSVATAPPRQAILQLRIAMPTNIITCGLPEANYIKKGVISWRYLP